MSRYTLEPRADRPDINHAVIGWDRPLETFFAQVFTRASPEEDPSVWVGTDFRELQSPEAAMAQIEGYAILPPDMRSRLLHDYADGPSRPPNSRFIP